MKPPFITGLDKSGACVKGFLFSEALKLNQAVRGLMVREKVEAESILGSCCGKIVLNTHIMRQRWVKTDVEWEC